MRLDNINADTYAGLGIRYNSSVSCEVTSRCGYSALIYGDGTWKLLDMDSVAAEGRLQRLPLKEWHRIKLLVLGDSILFFVDGNMVTSYRPKCIVNSGRISLLSYYDMTTFRNIEVSPMHNLPHYVRRSNCFNEGIFYNEFWEVCTAEKYTFYNRTAMKAMENAAFSCKFTGTGIAVIGTAEDAMFHVTVDGETMYDEHFVSYCGPRQACFVIDQLPEGEHTLHVTLLSGEFKLDVLEIPENHVMMPDILTVTSQALAAAVQREDELYKMRLAQQQAALNAARTLEQAVESLADEEEDEDASEAINAYHEETRVPERQLFENKTSDPFIIKPESMMEESFDEVPAEEEPNEPVAEETADEIIPEFASLITPALNEAEVKAEEEAKEAQILQEFTEKEAAPIPETCIDLPEAVEIEAETHSETDVKTAAHDIYSQVTAEVKAEEKQVTPTPAPTIKEVPLAPSMIIESEDAPSFRPDFNIDIEV